MPGNGGTGNIAVNVTEVDPADNNAIKGFCLAKKIDLVVVGPEAALARGITDVLEEAGIKVCGPSYVAARLEASKIFAKELMARYNIPTAEFRIFDDVAKAEKYINSVGVPVVIKADGLAAGKGVVVATTIEEAVNAAKAMLEDKIFGSAGHKIIVEECLGGEEVSILVITDGKKIVPLATSQDHKRVFNDDKGPNTGGMGAYSPASIADKKMLDQINKTILQPTINGMRKEGMTFKGILYAGLMITKNGPKVLEYNVRFGDPETQAILPRMKSDIVDIFEEVAFGRIESSSIKWENKTAVCVVLASGGYPGDFEKGKEITGIKEAEKEGVMVFHAGTAMKDGKLVTAGGRVLNVVGTGKNIEKALEQAYKGIKKIKFDGMHYRTDIGYREVKRTAAKKKRKIFCFKREKK